MEPTLLREMAKEYGWTHVATKNKYLLSFRAASHGKQKNMRINIYYTTGTIGVCYPHEKEKYTKGNTIQDVELMFANKGYENEGR